MTDADLEWKMLQGMAKLWADWSRDYVQIMIDSAKVTHIPHQPHESSPICIGAQQPPIPVHPKPQPGYHILRRQLRSSAQLR